MKKLGFTLAEVLIALAIIGVVAAITLPTLVGEHQKDVWAKSLSVAVSDFERAMGAMIMRDGAYDLTGTEAWKYAIEEGELRSDSPQATIDGFVENIKKVLKVDYKYKNSKELYEGMEVKYLDGEEVEEGDGFWDEDFVLTGKNDISYLIYIPNPMGNTFKFAKESEVLNAGGSLYKSVVDLYIDVNGNKKPNIFGRDIFTFKVGIDGVLYPIGGKDYSIWQEGDDTAHWTKLCTDTNKGIGTACTGRLIENGYKMDY